MPAFKKDLHCPFCSFRFTATIRTQPGDGPDTEYVVYCPENDSRLKVLRRELTEEIEQPPAGAVEALPSRPRSTTDPQPGASPWPALLFAGGMLLAGLAGLAWLRGWW